MSRVGDRVSAVAVDVMFVVVDAALALLIVAWWVLVVGGALAGAAGTLDYIWTGAHVAGQVATTGFLAAALALLARAILEDL